MQTVSLPPELPGKPILYRVVYICQSQSPSSPHPSLFPLVIHAFAPYVNTAISVGADSAHCPNPISPWASFCPSIITMVDFHPLPRFLYCVAFITAQHIIFLFVCELAIFLLPNLYSKKFKGVFLFGSVLYLQCPTQNEPWINVY